MQSLGLSLLLLSAQVPAPPAVVPGRAVGIEDQVVALLRGSGVPEKFVHGAFADPRRQFLPDVPPQIGKPAESLPYEEYRKIFLTEPRVAAGAQFAADQDALLKAVSAKYGVDPLLLLSLVGVETFYGRGTGKYVVFNALDTMAEKVPARSAFGTRELSEWLKLCWEDKLDPFSVKGSYAGAFGYGQFIPSTFNRYAVDFDGDGKRSFDRWPDVLASIANYLVKNGYPTDTRDFSKKSRAWWAVHAYNHSENYVDVVLELRQLVGARTAPRP